MRKTLNQIRKLIEDVLGEYDKEVDDIITRQILKIITQTGKFNADDWILEVIRPEVSSSPVDTEGSQYVFSLDGAVRLIPKPQAPREIQDSLLEGAQINHYKTESRPGYVNIVIKGHQNIDMVVGGSLRFNFELEMRTTDTRFGGVIEESLGY